MIAHEGCARAEDAAERGPLADVHVDFWMALHRPQGTAPPPVATANMTGVSMKSIPRSSMRLSHVAMSP